MSSIPDTTVKALKRYLGTDVKVNKGKDALSECRYFRFETDSPVGSVPHSFMATGRFTKQLGGKYVTFIEFECPMSFTSACNVIITKATKSPRRLFAVSSYSHKEFCANLVSELSTGSVHYEANPDGTHGYRGVFMLTGVLLDADVDPQYAEIFDFDSYVFKPKVESVVKVSKDKDKSKSGSRFVEEDVEVSGSDNDSDDIEDDDSDDDGEMIVIEGDKVLDVSRHRKSKDVVVQESDHEDDIEDDDDDGDDEEVSKSRPSSPTDTEVSQKKLKRQSKPNVADTVIPGTIEKYFKPDSGVKSVVKVKKEPKEARFGSARK